MKEKIKTQDEILKIVSDFKKEKKTVVFTNGCFDILHVGHARYLKEAGSLGDVLVVGINSDESVKKLKGSERPVFPQDERAEMLSSLESVDYVVIFNEDTPVNIISLIKPDIHVKGGDYDPDSIPEAEAVKSCGGKVKIVKFHQGFSTTSIIGRMAGENEL